MTTAQQIFLRALMILLSPFVGVAAGIVIGLILVWTALFEPDIFDEAEDIEQ